MGVSRLLNSCAITAAMVPMVASRWVSVSSCLTRSSCCCTKAICRVSCSSVETVEGELSLTQDMHRRKKGVRLMEQFVGFLARLLDQFNSLFLRNNRE